MNLTESPMSDRRPPELRRSWLFVGGSDEAALAAVNSSEADVVILELEDFTPPSERAWARTRAVDMFERWRGLGMVAAVRINPLDTEDGPVDLEAVMEGGPDVVMMPKIAEPSHVARLAEEVTRLESQYGLAAGSTELVPNIEFARGLIQTYDICTVSDRVTGALVASEDMAADIGAERGRDGRELEYVRQRFIVECAAARTPAIDCPYTWTDTLGMEADTKYARRLGYKSKSCVNPDQAAIANAMLTPAPDEVEHCHRIVSAFEAAQSRGAGRVEVDGSLVEVPIYMNAKRLLERAEKLAAWEEGTG